MKGKVRELTIRGEGSDLFVFADGLKIAKRGHPNTPHAKTWIPLEPGWTVFDGPGYLEVIYNGVRVH